MELGKLSRSSTWRSVVGASRGSVALGASGFIRRTLRLKLLFELLHEAENRPGGGLAEGANGTALNVLRDMEQIVGIFLPPFAVSETMQSLVHPQRALAARRALSAALVSVELSDV